MRKMGCFGAVWGYSRSWAMPPFDRAHTNSYSTLIETMRLSCTVFEIEPAIGQKSPILVTQQAEQMTSSTQQQQHAAVSCTQQPSQSTSSTMTSSSSSSLPGPSDESPGSSAAPKRLHISNIPFRFREQDLRNLLEVRNASRSRARFVFCRECALVVRCWCGCLSGARSRLAYGPADSTASHCLLLQ